MYVTGKTAYLGDEHSYSHAAAVLMTDGELVGYGAISDVLQAVGRECDAAVVPVENNVEGAVNEVYDALSLRRLFISRELVLPVRHSLIGESGVALSDIDTVVSHPQAIAQCRKFLSGLHGVKILACPSTSDALNKVGGSVAAVAFKPKEGQAVIKSGITDSSLNATRFALVSRLRWSSGGTVSISFDIKDEPGALLSVLEVFYREGINLTRILSRPHRSGDGKYGFFADFDFTDSDTALDKTLSAVAERCESFGFLGRYDCTTAEL